jgi:hypothetical protein
VVKLNPHTTNIIPTNNNNKKQGIVSFSEQVWHNPLQLTLLKMLWIIPNRIKLYAIALIPIYILI